MAAALHKVVNRSATPRPVPAAVPMRSVPTGTVQLQSTMRVSSPRDPAEKEADATARKILRMAAPTVAGSPGDGSGGQGDVPLSRKLASPYIARFAQSIRLMRQRAAVPTIARKGDGPPDVGANVAADIARSQGAGAPLPTGVRKFMEPRFGADFNRVRIHTGEQAARLSRQVSAQAFTVGNQLFFGKDQFQPDTPQGQQLIAHELTHTLQQGATVQHGAPVQRTEDVTVAQQSPPHVQRFGIGNVLGHVADAASALPGFRMLTLVLGVNPINMRRVDRSAANILRALVEFIPGGVLITRALDKYEVFPRVASWVERQLRTLALSGKTLRGAISSFIDSLGWRDLFKPGDVWKRAKRIITEPIKQLVRFAKDSAGAILDFLKDAILRPIASLASKLPGWGLLCAVLGRNPITGAAVPRSAEPLIGGFMKLIGQEEIWRNIQRGNAVSQAWAWFQGALSGLLGFVQQLPGRFVAAVRALRIADIVDLPQAFSRVSGVFGSFLGRFRSWAGNTVWNLLEIIFSVVAPGVMVYLRRAAGAFRTILQDPVRFVRYLVQAGELGFRRFSERFLTHLRLALVGWLTGTLRGTNIYIPQGFSSRELIKFVLSVLGLTWQNIRRKLVREIGEPATRTLETGFAFVKLLVTQGPAGAAAKLQESLPDLRTMVRDRIMAFVHDRVVKVAVTRIASMLSPAGAFIQAIIATYNTVMFFVERMRQIAQVAASFINSISAIAAGNIASAASRVEQTMGGMLTLVISFLARIAGLGRVTDAVTSVVDRVRRPMDRALDRLVAWIVAQARRLGGLLSQQAHRIVNWWAERRQMRLGDGKIHTLRFARAGQRARLMLASAEMPVQNHLEAEIRGGALDDAEKGRARGALQFFNDNIAPLTSQSVPANPQPALQAKIDALPDNLNRLSALLVGVGQGTKLALPPQPVWRPAGPHRSGVERLTNRTSLDRDTSPSSSPKGWKLLVAYGLSKGNRGDWVRMHMVTGGIGGPAIAGNLLPAPTAVNTGSGVRRFEKQVERILYGETRASEIKGKWSLFKHLGERNAVLWVETATLGFWPAYTNPANSKIQYDATTFAARVSFKAGLHFPRNNDWAKDPTAVVQADVPVPRPDFTADYRPNINAIGEPTIAERAGIGPHFARELVEERGGTPGIRPFTDPNNFLLRMAEHRKRRGVAETPEFSDALKAVVRAVQQGRMKWID